MQRVKEKLQRGLQSHQAGDLPAAASVYRQILRIDSGHSDALHLLGVVQMQSNQPSEAVELIEQAIRRDATNPIYYSNLGASYRAMGKLDEAIAAYLEALRLDPEYAQARYNLGCAWEAQSNFVNAELAYRETLARLPDFAQAWNNLGNILSKSGRAAEAVEAFQELTRLQPNSAEGFFNLGNTYLALGQIEEARRAYLAAQALNPQLPGLNFSLGNLAHQAGDLATAVACYEQELSENPQDSKALIHLGNALAEKGQVSEALVKFQESATGMARACLDQARWYRAQGKYKEAAAEFDQAMEQLAEDPQPFMEGMYAHLQSGNQFRAVEIADLAAAKFADSPIVHHHRAILLRQLGRREEAILALQRSLELKPNASEAEYELGNLLMEVGRCSEASSHFQRTVELSPEQYGAWNNLGNVYSQSGEWDKAFECFQKATSHGSTCPEAFNNLGNAYQGRKQYDLAIPAYLRSIELRNDYADAYRNLAQAYHFSKQFDAAKSAYESAIRIRPAYFEAWNNLGIIHQDLQDYREAERCYREALKINPSYKDARNNLAFLVHMRGDHDAAIADLKDLLSKHEDPASWNNLGIALTNKDRIDEAFVAYKKSAEQDVSYADPHNNMGILYASLGRMTEALQSYERALKLRPEFPEAYNNMGTALQVQGSIAESIAAYREALRLRPGYSEARSNLLFTLNYDTQISPQDLMLEYKAWDRQNGRNEIPVEPHLNVVDPGRRLRVGYVSPDFRVHSVAYYIEPILAHHNPEQFETFAYAQVLNPDSMTAKIRAHTHHWRSTCGWNDAQLAEQVRQDQIDILVDLTGHTGRNRLPTFARKPAPIQVTYLGYPNTTGLSRMDYRLTDEIADPVGDVAWHSEELVRLPHGFLCYRPLASAPNISIPPVFSKGHITFGSFNSQSKIHDDVYRIWARILLAVPGSRLLLKNRPLADAGIREKVWGTFESLGVARERVELMGQIAATEHHLDAYRHIDIGLDTFPYNGTTTTCEALWMGVPVLAVRGNTHASRVGASLLTRIGLTELLAESEDDYVGLASAWAADRQKLFQTRWSLRQRLQNSELCNARRFTLELEVAFRQMWQTWCAAQTRES